MRGKRIDRPPITRGRGFRLEHRPAPLGEWAAGDVAKLLRSIPDPQVLRAMIEILEPAEEGPEPAEKPEALPEAQHHFPL